MAIRAKVQDLEPSSPLKFCTRSVLQTNDARVDILKSNYFMNCYNKLAPGDEITVCCMRDDATWDKGDFEVIVALPGNVVVAQITDWRHGGVQHLEGLTAEHKGFGKWTVTDQASNVIASGISKAQAQALVAGGEKEAAA